MYETLRYSILIDREATHYFLLIIMLLKRTYTFQYFHIWFMTRDVFEVSFDISSTLCVLSPDINHNARRRLENVVSWRRKLCNTCKRKKKLRGHKVIYFMTNVSQFYRSKAKKLRWTRNHSPKPQTTHPTSLVRSYGTLHFEVLTPANLYPNPETPQTTEVTTDQ